MATVADRLFLRRRIINAVGLFFSGIAAVIGLFFLLWICWTTLSKGLTALSLDLFTQMTPPPGEDGGGLLNPIFGSLLMCTMAVLIATPIGVAAGTFLAEYSRSKWLAESIRFLNDILLSAPSIVMGLFVYTFILHFLKPDEQFSGYAGAVALAMIVLPVIVRTTDEMLRLVPTQMREAALSLGIPQWKVTTQVLYRSAMSGILTGVLLGLARISGETAPLLFTAFNNQYWNANPGSAMANLPVTVYQFAMSPFEQWNQLAWAGAFLITLFVLLVSLLARTILLRNKVSHD